MSLPNIFKLSQTIWELWPAQDFCFRGYEYIEKKVRVVSLLCYIPAGTYLCLPNIIKIFHIIKKLWCSQEFALEIRSGEITRRRTQQDLSFLHAILLLDLIYVPINYYQILSNSMGVMACRKFWLQGT